MIEKNSNININDLFSQFSKIKKTNKDIEITNMLKEKEDRLTNLIKPLNEINEQKQKIISDSEMLNYKKENISANLFLILQIILHTTITLYALFMSIIIMLSFMPFLNFFKFKYIVLPEQTVFLNILSVISILLIITLGTYLKKNKINLLDWDFEKSRSLEKKVIGLSKKIILTTKWKDTCEYILSNYKSTIYYETKTGDELYDSFLMEEICQHKEKDNKKNKIVGEVCVNSIKEEILKKTNIRHQEYLREKREFELIKIYVRKNSKY